VSQSSETAGLAEPSTASGAGWERLGIAGSGTIACGLAAAAIVRGMEVSMWARSRESARRARNEIRRGCEKLDRQEAAEFVRMVPRLSGLAHATLVVEAVKEDPALKRDTLAALSELLSQGSMVASTTSSLGIAQLAHASGRADHFFGLHVFNPVTRMELVEVCFPDEANSSVRERALVFCQSLGKTAVEVPDEPGFVVNRLLFPYLFDAVRLLERTGMRPEQVDACMKLGASYPMGPLELLDLVGLDVAEAIGEALHADTGDPAHRPPGRIKQLVGQGKLGRKSGSGFYGY
jgi:3-hydroxybutyryl-CoA dehydrogenase